VWINIYYLADCPSLSATAKRIKEVLTELGLAGKIREIPLSLTWAPFLHFDGSPTVHINGRDIEPSARTSKRVSFSYRTYRNGQQIERLPSKTMIRDALLEAQSNVLIIPIRKRDSGRNVQTRATATVVPLTSIRSDTCR
jgi:hypothetical protein